MPKIKKKWQGKSPHRYEDNPLEKEFAWAWQEANDRFGSCTLDYMMNGVESGRPAVATDEQRIVANTVIQWLGTPVGQCFLEKVLRTKSGKAFLKLRLGFSVDAYCPECGEKSR
jgi:hypothetical protein